MSYTTGVVVWGYLMAATLAEMILFYVFPAHLFFEGVIGFIASINGIVAIIVPMELKNEPVALQFFLFVPVLLVSVLLLGMIFAYPTAG
jgi:hypothetical protein